jgi:hypothetical protein
VTNSRARKSLGDERERLAINLREPKHHPDLVFWKLDQSTGGSARLHLVPRPHLQTRLPDDHAPGGLGPVRLRRGLAQGLSRGNASVVSSPILSARSPGNQNALSSNWRLAD